MLIKPASMEDPKFFNLGSSGDASTIPGLPQNFITGCHLYQQNQFDKAAECFRRVLQSNDKSLHYEVRFNLGACLFKLAEFKMALRQFSTLMNE